MATRKLTYAEQIKHPLWQKRRLEMLESANWECTSCGCKETTLHVHHKQYIKGRMAWEYSNEELAVLCEECHEEEHAIGDELKALLAVIDNTQALALLRGFHDHSDWFDPMIGDIGRDRDPHTFAVGFTAYLLTYLSIGKIDKVAEFAASLMSETAEGRMIYMHNSGPIFGRD